MGRGMPHRYKENNVGTGFAAQSTCTSAADALTAARKLAAEKLAAKPVNPEK